MIMLLLAAALPQTVDELKKDLADKSYGALWDRRDAARDLGKLGTAEAADALLEFAGTASDPATREAIVLALSALKDDGVRRRVLDAAPRLKDEAARADVVWALRDMKWDGARDGLHGLLRDGSASVRVEVVRALGALGDPRGAEAVLDREPAVAAEALREAAKQKAPIDAKTIEKLLKHKAPAVVAAAVEWTAAVDPGADLAAHLKGAPEVRMAVADATASIEPLKTLLDDKEWRVRVAAIGGCERLWVKEAIPLLIDRLAKEDGRLILDIVTTLQRMTAKTLGYDAEAWRGWWDAQGAGFAMPEKPKGARQAAADPDESRVTFYNIPLLSKRIVFIIDCSGSMKTEDELYAGKRKIDVALDELDKAIAGLAKDAKFNVIMLSTEATAQKVRSLSPKLVPAAPQNRTRASELVKQAWAKLEDIKRGRGDIYDAVAEAWADPETDTVILLTDGKATDGRLLDRDHLIEAFARDHRERRVCIHAVLTGSVGTDEKGMQGFADVTGGLYMPRK